MNELRRGTKQSEINLFSRLKSHIIRSTDAYPGGRYMTIILGEVLRDAPGLASDLFDIRSADYVVEIENAHDTNRRADLLLSDNDGSLAIIEVKYEDEKSASIHGQVKDYLKYSKKNKCKFVLLSQYLPSRAIIQMIETGGGKHMTYADLYRSTISYNKKHDNPTVRLFCNFLREETQVFDETKIDPKTLKLLLVRGLDLENRNGLGRRLNTRDRLLGSIKLLRQLTENMGVLSDEFSQQFSLRRPNVGYTYTPYFHYNKAGKAIANELKATKKKDYADSLGANLKTGGFLWIGSWYSLGTKAPSLYLVQGFTVEVDLGKKAVNSPLKIECYAQVGGDEFQVNCKTSIGVLYSEDKLRDTLSERTRDAVSVFLKGNKCNSATKKKIEQVKTALQNRIK